MCSETYFKGKYKKECDNLPIILLTEKIRYLKELKKNMSYSMCGIGNKCCESSRSISSKFVFFLRSLQKRLMVHCISGERIRGALVSSSE